MKYSGVWWCEMIIKEWHRAERGLRIPMMLDWMEVEGGDEQGETSLCASF